MTTLKATALFFALALFSTAAGAHSYENCPKIWWKTHKGDGFVVVYGGLRAGRQGYSSVHITAVKNRRTLDITSALFDATGRFKTYLTVEKKRFSMRFVCR